jgi:hypothetical protein
MIHPVYTMLNCEMRHPAIRELDIFASGPGCSYISGDESSEIWRVTEGAELISSPRESLWSRGAEGTGPHLEVEMAEKPLFPPPHPSLSPSILFSNYIPSVWIGTSFGDSSLGPECQVSQARLLYPFGCHPLTPSFILPLTHLHSASCQFKMLSDDSSNLVLTLPYNLSNTVRPSPDDIWKYTN